MVRLGDAESIVGTNKLTPDSIQEALRMYLQPIKNDDPKLDFYTMYKQETTEYDTEYMQKYNEDLNTTLIFVCLCVPFPHRRVDRTTRPVCSPQSALPSSSTSSPSSSKIPVNGRKPIYAQYSSASTNLLLQTKIPPHPQSGMVPPLRSSQPCTFFTRAF